MSKKIKFIFQNGSEITSETITYNHEPTKEEIERDRTDFFFDMCSYMGIEAWCIGVDENE